MNNLFLVCNIVQAIALSVISIALTIMAIQVREIAKISLFTNDIEQAGVEIPEQPEQKEDYTEGISNLADVLNARLKAEFGEEYMSYMGNTRGKIPYELDNDFGITGAEVITDEDETKGDA